MSDQLWSQAMVSRSGNSLCIKLSEEVVEIVGLKNGNVLLSIAEPGRIVFERLEVEISAARPLLKLTYKKAGAEIIDFKKR